MQGREETDEGEGKVMDRCSLPVPPELAHPFFFPCPSMVWEPKFSQHFQTQLPFVHEAGFYNGIKGINPWEEPERYIPLILHEWKSLKEDLVRGHAIREQLEITGRMKQGICLFLEFVFWSNRVPASFPLAILISLKAKPVNVLERLEFIMNRPGLYHSFIQLSELMNEQQKQCAKWSLTFNQAKTKAVRDQ
jgi:hypothetical protein